MGFARGQKIDVADLTVEDGYVYANVTSVGAETKGLLPDLMKGIVTGLNFPKSMHWGSLDFHFVRPIRWFVALFDTEVIPFELANVQSGKVSRGHRFLGTGDFTIDDPASYEKICEEHFLIVDPEKRRQLILDGSRNWLTKRAVRSSWTTTSSKKSSTSRISDGPLRGIR